jgi:hypothetical protein
MPTSSSPALLSPRALLVCAALLVSLSAHAQVPVDSALEGAPNQSLEKDAAPPAPVVHHIKRDKKAEAQLIGTWRSVDNPAKQAPAGSMFFQPNGAIMIAPDGYRPLVSTWVANAKDLVFTTSSNGDALIHYTLSKNHKSLSLRYENGQEQAFFRLPTKSSTAP